VFRPEVVGEDAGEGASPREEVGEEKAVGVDGGAPGAANAPGFDESAAREMAEDVEEHVIGQAVTVVGRVHLGRPGNQSNWSVCDRWINRLISTILYGNKLLFSHNFGFIFCAPVVLARVFICSVIFWGASLEASCNFVLV
jgi:hypothetical protein